ncbi:glycosyltransferase family 4 protein [bacterium]|nr:glycosyltransferase family 4 protein [bacterium]
MRICFNALCAENRSGTGRYATQLLSALARIDAVNEYIVCVHADSPLRARLAHAANFSVEPVVRGGILQRHLFERRNLADWIRSKGPDVFHGPAFIVPRGCPVPSVATIHDLVFRIFPETTPLTRRGHYRRDIPRSIREAGILLADSHSTAMDVQGYFSVPGDRVRVAHLGVEPVYFEKPSEEVRGRVRERYGLPERFILTVGTLEPRKNVPGLLRAYALFVQGQSDVPALALTGRAGWGVRGLRRAVRKLGLEGRVFFPGFVAEADLSVAYHLAEAFVSASIYEGFGLPVLEAMAAGLPVVAGNNSSIPEIVGDGGWLVDVACPESLAEGMAIALTASPERERRRECAGERARGFTWEETARRTVAVYERVGR